MARKTNATGNTKIETVRHKDKRRNIPTEELRGFVQEDEQRPRQVTYPGLLYARDPSLDPQLVWKGKDEQDREPLTVPAVPIYIQEKIHPQVIIEDVRTQARKAQPADQMELFADFNGIAFEEMIEFYQHEASWSNRMILGDSLLVMTSLAEKEGLKGRVQTIYIDPPYGIKFGSNWQVSTRKRDVKDGKAEDATRQPEQIRAFRDTWELGIHSYLAYWRDRLIVARELLTESGSVFVQIGDENVHLVRCVLDEVFGSENFCVAIPFVKTTSQTSKLLSAVNDYLLWYARDIERVKYRSLFSEKEAGGGGGINYTQVQLSDGMRRSMTKEEKENPQLRPADSKIFSYDNLTSTSGGENSRFPVEMNGEKYRPITGFWKTNAEGMERLKLAHRVEIVGNILKYVRLFVDFPVMPLSNFWSDTAAGGFSGEKYYVVQTTAKVIERCLLMTTDPGDLVLDPTCGSGTTAFVAEQWGRRWITIDTSRVAIALARTRLMAARFPYYLLADSPEGVRKEAEFSGKFVAPDVRRGKSGDGSESPPPHVGGYNVGGYNGDIKRGFVYKRVPHVTLKSIANNPDIKEGMSRQEIDAAIARHAETELLYDQPYEDGKRIRVTGPFTVESLSPHRTISVEEKRRREKEGFEGWKIKEIGPAQFGHIIIENLKKAGVQNTIKQERLKFDRLEPFAGTWIHAAGEYTERDGKTRRVAVCIGPEHGTVGPELVREAAKEAVKGVGFDLLLVCGFAFDPHVNEEARQYGKLVVLPTRINADLQMGDEFLKKTGAANLFMVFGEPDIELSKTKDGKIVVEIKGLDIYDPTTGEIRNNTTDDVACWFIDTNYNGESFFVRHAYFTGAGDPYDRLKRALRAEINEAAWSALYSTRSRPFDPPETGKIAVKVINHYGDEVLKVYEMK